MLSESDVAVDQRGIDRRKLRRTQVFLSKQRIDWPGACSRKETSLGVDPGIVDVDRDSSTRVIDACGYRAVGIQVRTSSGADENGPGSDQGYQLVRVDGESVLVTAVLEIVSRHLVILIGGEHVLDKFPVLSAMQLCSARA